MCASWHFNKAGAFSPRGLIICSLSFKEWHSSPIFLWWALGGRRWRLSVIATTVLGPADKTLTSEGLCEIQINDLYVAWRHAKRTRVLWLTSTDLLGPELSVTHWLLSFYFVLFKCNLSLTAKWCREVLIRQGNKWFAMLAIGSLLHVGKLIYQWRLQLQIASFSPSSLVEFAGARLSLVNVFC